MAFRDLNEEFRYEAADFKVDPKTGRRSAWVFRKNPTDDDEDLAAAKAYRTTTKVDELKLKRARREGKDYIPEIEQERLSSARVALLDQMSLRFEGPEFYVPENAGTPYDGTIPEVSPETINLLLSPKQIMAAFDFMRDVWNGRTPEEQATFPAESGSVALAVSDGAGEHEADDAGDPA